MPDPGSVAAIRAAADAIAPAGGATPGAADLGVEGHVVEQVEGFMPGYADLIAALLNAYAAGVREGAAFADLPADQRRAVLRLMRAEESQDVRTAADALWIFTLGGMYSEWTTFDPETRDPGRPAVWNEIGYHGPSDGVPEYREGI